METIRLVQAAEGRVDDGGPHEDDLVQYRNSAWKVGRVHYHPKLQKWVVVMADGRMWESLAGQWITEIPSPPRCRQQIGVDVTSCPATSEAESQPERYYGPRTTSPRRQHIAALREAGVSPSAIARELGISRERVRQLLDDIKPRWRNHPPPSARSARRQAARGAADRRI